MSDVKHMTKRQLADVVADYATVFPGWLPFRGQGFFRDAPPVRQMIWFEPLSTTGLSPYYRPACGLRSLVMPTVRMLHYFIGERFQPTLSQHPSLWRNVVSEMERVFAPNISAAIDVAEVAALCAAEERDDSPNDLAMMAVLRAWLGQRDEARRRCIRLQALPTPDRPSMIAWDKEMRTFALALARAIEAGAEQDFLVHTAHAAAGRPELNPDLQD